MKIMLSYIITHIHRGGGCCRSRSGESGGGGGGSGGLWFPVCSTTVEICR